MLRQVIDGKHDSSSGCRQPAEGQRRFGQSCAVAKKGLQRFRFSGSIRTAKYLNSPLVGTPTPPLPAGFVFLGLRFSVQLIESTRRIAPRKGESGIDLPDCWGALMFW